MYIYSDFINTFQLLVIGRCLLKTAGYIKLILDDFRHDQGIKTYMPDFIINNKIQQLRCFPKQN